uniref:Putative secreted protein n=1 Tax=Amblyomma triste TaxID=251400 RepID=A0A023G3U8_AMBTT
MHTSRVVVIAICLLLISDVVYGARKKVPPKDGCLGGKNGRRRMIDGQTVNSRFPCQQWYCSKGSVTVTNCTTERPNLPCMNPMPGKFPTCCQYFYLC